VLGGAGRGLRWLLRLLLHEHQPPVLGLLPQDALPPRRLHHAVWQGKQRWQRNPLLLPLLLLLLLLLLLSRCLRLGLLRCRVCCRWHRLVLLLHRGSVATRYVCCNACCCWCTWLCARAMHSFLLLLLLLLLLQHPSSNGSHKQWLLSCLGSRCCGRGPQLLRLLPASREGLLLMLLGAAAVAGACSCCFPQPLQHIHC
jgi:hypothetical protein